jgi:hypothetical protein
VSQRAETQIHIVSGRRNLEAESGVSDTFQLESDGYEAAKERARNLLLEILPPLERDRFCNNGVIHVTGSRTGDVYQISAGSQTAIHHQGRVIAYACLQLSIPFPAFDRMVAEYLLIKNDENLYLLKANVFANNRSLRIATLFLIVFDVALVVNLVLAVYGLK